MAPLFVQEFPDPAVTVVVPAYNATRFISDTLLSVLMQSFLDFELVVVDDGSTDDLSAVLDSAVLRDGRIRLVAQSNAGLACARNRGLAEARGELVAFLDADDLWHPDFLKDLVAALRVAPAAPFAYAYSRRIDAQNRVIPTSVWASEPRHDFSGLIEVNSVGNGSAAVFRTAAVRAQGGFDPSLRARGAQGAEDWKLCLLLAAGHPPVLVARQLVCYRLMQGSMSQANPARQLHAVRTVVADIRAAFPKTADRHFRNARTMMNGWLFSAFMRKRDWRMMLSLLASSYLLNPLWFLSRDLRAVHRQKFASLFADFAGRVPLSELEEHGTRPFGYLQLARNAGSGLVPGDFKPVSA